MAGKNSQRILSLILCLSDTRVPLTRSQIQERVEWYRSLPERNFLATFERDKALIRDWGIEIEVPGDGSESAYQIQQDSLTLPPLDFTAQEAGLIAAAARIWEHTRLTSESNLALAKLRAAGVELDGESQLPDVTLPVRSPKIDVLLEALTARQAVRFRHGDSPERVVEPWYLHFRLGQWYLFGWDRSKDESRAFLVSKIAEVPEIMWTPQSIAQPTEDYEVMVQRAFSAPGDRIAKLAVRRGIVSDLRRNGTPVDGGTPEFELWEVPYASDEYHVDRFSRMIVGEGADVLVLEPADLRARVIDQLEKVVARG